MRAASSLPIVAPFADRLLAVDLPELPTEHRERTVAFICRRVDGLPSVMYLGVMFIALLHRAVLVLPGSDRFVRLMGSIVVPILSEYVRMLRSLGYAFIWETWPDTSPVGAPQSELFLV
jgi:hypothetical protein